MTPTSSQFQELKLVTRFEQRRYTHTIADSEETVRYETWTQNEVLGEGAFSTVYKQICAERGLVRAVKQIRRSFVRWHEIAILARLRSYPQHFVKLSGWFEDETHIYLAMEYLPGDLGTLLKDRSLNLPESGARRITEQVLVGLEILHKENICHRDLKPSNILIAQWIPLSIRIADFGVSKPFDNTECRTTLGTSHFMAPEVWGFSNEETSVYTTAVDIWSLGCLVFLMMTNELPFPETRNMVDFIHGRSPFPPSTALTIPDLAIGLIASMLQPLPKNRPTASKAKLHSWLLIKESTDIILTDIPPGPSKPTSGPERTQMVTTRDPAPASAKRKLTPLDTPSTNKQPRLSDPKKKHRASAIVGERDLIQHLLAAAAISGNCEALIEALGKGARPLEDLDSGDTSIYIAAKNGHLPIIKLLLNHGAHLGVEGKRQVSALHGAAEGGNLQIAQYLLDEGADLSAKTKDGYTALHYAAQFGSIDVLKLLVDRGADISIQGEEPVGWNPLLLAARYGHLDNVQYLLERGADISAKKLDTGFNALHIAAQFNHPEMGGLLLERGADLAARTDGGYMALHTAAQFGSIDVLKLLIDRGTDISVRGGGETVGWTSLLLAARYGYLDIVRYLLERGADISAKKLDNGKDALHLAAEFNHPRVAGLLLERGADLSEKSQRGYKALHTATQFDSVDVLKLLVDSGTDILVRDDEIKRWAPLLSATYNGRLDRVRNLLDSGVDISVKQLDTGFNALHIAAQFNYSEMGGLLLERGADPSAKTKRGYMALHTAAQLGSIDVMKLLIDRGADISVRGGGETVGWTSLLLAARYGYLDIVRYLLERGADISSKKLDTGSNALHIAAQFNHPKVASLLLARGADLSEKSQRGYTALHYAAKSGSIDVSKLLIDRGADISVRGGGETLGWTSLLLAARYGYLDIVQYLLERGADISAKKLDNGKDALHLAAEFNHPKVVGLLLERGADLSEKSQSGYTALHAAAQLGSVDVLKLLVDRGADISVRCGTVGWTALVLAARAGCLNSVRYLLEGGERRIPTKSESATAISLATVSGHTDIVRLLNEWPKRDVTMTMTIPSTRPDVLNLSDSLMQETTSHSEDESTASDCTMEFSDW